MENAPMTQGRSDRQVHACKVQVRAREVAVSEADETQRFAENSLALRHG